MAAHKLTKTFIDGLKAPESGYIIFDTELSRFGLRLLPSGSKTYVIQYRNQSGQTRKLALGAHGVLTPDEARKRARKLLGRVDNGEDPAGEKAAAREAATVRELMKDYFDVYAPQKGLRAETVKKNQRFHAIIDKAIGTRKVADITQQDIRKLHLARKDTPTDANRMLAFLSLLFTLAMHNGQRGTNPCKGIPRYPEQARSRFLADDELVRLLDALAQYPDQNAANAIRLILLTGCRPQEAIKARWEQFDLTACVWTMPSHETKQKREHRVELSAQAAGLVQSMSEKRGDSDFLFPTPSARARLSRARFDVRRPWLAVTKAAGLDDVHLHDLRHNSGSRIIPGAKQLLFRELRRCSAFAGGVA